MGQPNVPGAGLREDETPLSKAVRGHFSAVREANRQGAVVVECLREATGEDVLDVLGSAASEYTDLLKDDLVTEQLRRSLENILQRRLARFLRDATASMGLDGVFVGCVRVSKEDGAGLWCRFFLNPGISLTRDNRVVVAGEDRGDFVDIRHAVEDRFCTEHEGLLEKGGGFLSMRGTESVRKFLTHTRSTA